jgi:hypothetical protein
VKSWASALAEIDAEFEGAQHREHGVAPVEPHVLSDKGVMLELANVGNPMSDEKTRHVHEREGLLNPSEEQILSMTPDEFARSGLVVTIRTPQGILYLIAAQYLAEGLPDGSVWLTGREMLELVRLSRFVELNASDRYRIAKAKCLLKAQVVKVLDRGLLLQSPLHRCHVALHLKEPRSRKLPKDEEPTRLTLSEVELLAGLADDKISQVLLVVRTFGQLTERHSK